LSGTVEELSGTVQDLSGTVEELSGTVQDLSGTVEDLSGTVDDLSGVVFENLNTLSGDIFENVNMLSGDIQNLSGIVTNNFSTLSGAIWNLQGWADLQTVDDLDQIKEIVEFIRDLSGDVSTNLINTNVEMGNNMNILSGMVDTLSGQVKDNYFPYSGGKVFGDTDFASQDNSKIAMEIDIQTEKVITKNVTVKNQLFIGDSNKWRIVPDENGTFLKFEYNPYAFLSGLAESKNIIFRI
jgi:methyl-accepting chemotaxis protein